MKTAREEAARILRIARNAHDTARAAEAMIRAMPETVENLQMVLDAIEAKMQAMTWADFSGILDPIQDASIALDKVTTYDYEDMARANAQDVKFQQHRDDRMAP